MKLLVLLLLVAQSALAGEILLEESRSPNGQFAFYVIDPAAPGVGPGLELRDTRSGDTVAHLNGGGYYWTAALVAEETKVFWSPGSRWFAIRRRGTKRSREIQFYYMNHGRAEPVPAPDFLQNVFGREGVVSRGRYLFEEPVGWQTPEIGLRWVIDRFSFVVSGGLPDELIEPGETELYRYHIVVSCHSGENAAPYIRLVSVGKQESSQQADGTKQGKSASGNE